MKATRLAGFSNQNCVGLGLVQKFVADHCFGGKQLTPARRGFEAKQPNGECRRTLPAAPRRGEGAVRDLDTRERVARAPAARSTKDPGGRRRRGSTRATVPATVARGLARGR